DLLGGGGAGHGVGRHLDLGAGHLAVVDLHDPAVVREHDLQRAVFLRPPEPALDVRGPEDVPLLVEQPGPGGVDEVGLAVVAERHLLAVARALDRRVAEYPGALPPTRPPRRRNPATPRPAPSPPTAAKARTTITPLSIPVIPASLGKPSGPGT